MTTKKFIFIRRSANRRCWPPGPAPLTVLNVIERKEHCIFRKLNVLCLFKCLRVNIRIEEIDENKCKTNVKNCEQQ